MTERDMRFGVDYTLGEPETVKPEDIGLPADIFDVPAGGATLTATIAPGEILRVPGDFVMQPSVADPWRIQLPPQIDAEECVTIGGACLRTDRRHLDAAHGGRTPE